jgi:hypothetical protein
MSVLDLAAPTRRVSEACARASDWCSETITGYQLSQVVAESSNASWQLAPQKIHHRHLRFPPIENPS